MRRFRAGFGGYFELIDANILSAENEVSDLEATFAAPEFHVKPRAEISGLDSQLKTARITAGR